MHLSMSSPRGGGGGGGFGQPTGILLCDVYSQGGDFDHLIFQLQRADEK